MKYLKHKYNKIQHYKILNIFKTMEIIQIISHTNTPEPKKSD